MINNNPTEKPIDDTSELVKTVEKMVEAQVKSFDIQTQELIVQQQNIESNEKVALASISAQKEDRLKWINAISKQQTQKNILYGIITFGIISIIIISMLTENTEFALEFLKIGGGVLIGFVAGINKGKYESSQENKNQNQ